MLEESAKKQCYDELKHLFLGNSAKYPDELRGIFDVVTAAAILAEGHLTTRDIFEEFDLSLK